MISEKDIQIVAQLRTRQQNPDRDLVGAIALILLIPSLRGEDDLSPAATT